MGLGTALAGAATTREMPLTSEEVASSASDIVALVKDARTGEISLFVGEREVTIHDRTVAARLVRATR
jgi:hypothetical protein